MPRWLTVARPAHVRGHRNPGGVNSAIRMQSAPVVTPVAVLTLNVGQSRGLRVLSEHPTVQANLSGSRRLPALRSYRLIPTTILDSSIVTHAVTRGAVCRPVSGRVLDVLGKYLRMAGITPGVKLLVRSS